MTRKRAGYASFPKLMVADTRWYGLIPKSVGFFFPNLPFINFVNALLSHWIFRYSFFVSFILSSSCCKVDSETRAIWCELTKQQHFPSHVLLGDGCRFNRTCCGTDSFWRNNADNKRNSLALMRPLASSISSREIPLDDGRSGYMTDILACWLTQPMTDKLTEWINDRWSSTCFFDWSNIRTDQITKVQRTGIVLFLGILIVGKRKWNNAPKLVSDQLTVLQGTLPTDCQFC